MTEPEQMEALKKVYAEMILHTAKEAAARVMAAELRSRQLEQDMVSAKDEAARMLLRLKQMNDARVKEAELTSSNQQRKFDELESQLNEAENIIVDLRAELDQAQDQLIEVKNKRLSYINQKENTESRNTTPFSTPSLDWNTLDEKCCSPAKQSTEFTPECDVFSGDSHPNLDEIKEPELLKNGCTQRICAIETLLVNGEKSDPSKIYAVGSTSVSQENVQSGKNEAVSVVRRSHRKRKLKYWDDVIAACGLRNSNQSKKPRHHLSHCNAGKVKSGEGRFLEEDECPKK
ncbi:hypothetical protein ABFS82_08G018100 [Erythranthe guttata]|nr:PREDICTED: uncharacterized protein LOC105961706 [Erythranthe guttata]|eukprot:XP_012841415.1 PREDICTED: uncharacterized protein LOC105961706 [Erythranthe guttata]